MVMMTRAERRRQERQAANRTTYQYTLEQIEAIRKQAVRDAKEQMKAEIAKEIDDHIKAEWKEREKEMSGENEEERIEKVLALLMSVPARILCEKFHWKGVRDENDHRSKLLQFSEAIVKEVNRICGDENADIRKYRDETYELYGVKYEVK
ncbi:hypothetical protein DW020_12215 [Clostridium sp. AF37-5AT]|nr:hypothetical protein DW260_13685 [Clostridium sp. AM22-16AC]RHO94252.1 hypothetical protein DW020_12215 [Clostridium sp. AF37-5AT]